MITIRILNICNNTKINQVTELVLKCRHIGEKWIELILNTIQNSSSNDLDQMNQLRDKVVIISTFCLLTFSVNTERLHVLLSSDEHVISLLKAVTSIHDNMILNKKQIDRSDFMKSLIRWSNRVSIMIQPTLTEFLQKTTYQSLNEFTSIYCGRFRNVAVNEGKWQKRTTDVYDGWYDGQYGSHAIAIDCLNGKFLFNGNTITFLPERITSNSLFRRIFDDHIFEVYSTDIEQQYITKHTYHGDENVIYSFHFKWNTSTLVVYEIHTKTNEIFELIPYDCFETELADIFVSNYSHWMNKHTQEIEFRSIKFNHPNFLKDKPYILNLKNGFIKTNNTEKTEILICQSSIFFQNLFQKYFIRLDDKPYVYMLCDNISQLTEKISSKINATVSIYLSRLGIAFKYNTQSQRIASREYADFFIDESQWFGTLTGLKRGLLLSSISKTHQKEQYYLSRKLIVPFGKISIKQVSNNDHQTVRIERTSSVPFLYQYFVFTLNDRLKILQSTDSPTGWLYLALLHAVTSHSLQDFYTGMTGMERAFQLLNSAGCWTDQPFDDLSSNILHQIAAISPKVNYYPTHLTCMEVIQWNKNGLSYSLQHFGYYLIVKKLIDTSEQLSFMYSNSMSQKASKLLENNRNNVRLLEKLYWDYRDSYNPTVRLSEMIEAEIISSSASQSPVKNLVYSQPSANYHPFSLTTDMYESGNVNLKKSSELHCFPLNRWLKSDYELKEVWIGLLKLAIAVKDAAAIGNRDPMEEFEILLDFLEYIAHKRSIKAFYLKMLKSVLIEATISWTSIIFPQFTSYNKIQEISCYQQQIKEILSDQERRRQISFWSFDTSSIRSLTEEQRKQIIEEVELCFQEDRTYTDNLNLVSVSEKEKINTLLTSWQLNKKLRSFLKIIETNLSLVKLQEFKIRLNITGQQFTVERNENHHKILLKSMILPIDSQLLSKAQQRYFKSYSKQLIKSINSVENSNQSKEFPEELFPSTQYQNNSLDGIMNYFKNHLNISWKQFQTAQETLIEPDAQDEINKLLILFRQESTEFWAELIQSITLFNELLFKTGLVLRITPTTLKSLLHQLWLNEEHQEQLTNESLSTKRSKIEQSCGVFLTKEQCALLGGTIVNWIIEQLIERA
ncbi:unnamed protein product [Rotaria sp. Silwood2]|nr:unnamed protein product [Rotaria sp. Silwood2]